MERASNEPTRIFCEYIISWYLENFDTSLILIFRKTERKFHPEKNHSSYKKGFNDFII